MRETSFTSAANLIAKVMAMAAIVNAVWDLYAKSEGKPLWKLLVDMIGANPSSSRDGSF